MPVSFETGDIFATETLQGFAHGCNCAGAMGKGVAVAFKQRWPRMYEEYKRRCKVADFRLGDVFVWQEDNEVIFNLGTQHSWKEKAELWAIEKSLIGMISAAEALGVDEIALPRIGAGLGGLAWASVRDVIERVGSETSIQLRVCDAYIAGTPLCHPLTADTNQSRQPLD